MWTKSKTVLMSLILIVAFSTVYLSFYLEAYIRVSKQRNPALFQYETCNSGIWYFDSTPVPGSTIVGSSLEPVSLPQILDMGDATTLHSHYFGIRLNSLTKVRLNIQSTAPICFQLVFDERNGSSALGEEANFGRAIINETQTTSLNSEFYLKDPGLYIFVFEPIITRPTATVTVDVQLN